MKRTRALGILWICVFMLSGCWDRIEINDLAFVTATGFDLIKENQIRVSIQVPLPSALGGAGSSGGGGGTGGNKPYYVDSTVGRNVREANDLLQSRMSRRSYFAHRRVIVFGEKLARSGFKKSLDLIVEQPQSRLTTFVLVTKGDAIDILNSSPHLEKLPAEAIRELTKAGYHRDVRDVLTDISRPGKDPVLPIVETVLTNNKKGQKQQEISINRLGILKNDQLMFITNYKETNGALWLLEQMQRRGYTFPIENQDEINVGIIKSKVKPEYTLKNNQPSFTLNVNVSANLMQNEGNLELNDPKNYRKAINKMETQIKEEIEAILVHSMSEGIDIYGLGWYLSRKESNLWKQKWEKDWNKLLTELDVKINVKAEIDEAINSALKIKE
ncbi:Ger(x)C family spore germination protein [Bacillus sp. DNRA2]|uniref:Ger(x)C family spore germination protein n=1 Tax=Bacillus sp. DNRA2 TaxID=2723053 RepID=UPI00145D33E5|nr:Ger(x)C family spore germination protein [Bacillus sp. DNRA2]NMD69181.1 Ger(x)C family spore germination protein [Bacillus sp. DNRA2]